MNTIPAFPEAPVPLDICFDVEIEASASAVFAGLTEDIGEWWGAPYLQANSAVDVVLDAKPGGMMLERAKGDDGAIWAFVQEIHRDRFLALEGRMHMAPAVYARTTFKLAEHGGRTQLSFAQHAVGHFNSRHGEIFAEGWRDLLGKRLKDFVEHGLSSGVRSAKEMVR